MRERAIVAYGVTVSIYECARGEGLLWHGPHGFSHGHLVLSGRTKVYLAEQGDESVVPNAKTILDRGPNDGNLELAGDTRHAIIAQDQGAVFVNLMPREIKPNGR